METIRKYFASGCDPAALSAEEQDALRSEARKLADVERRQAVRSFFQGLLREPVIGAVSAPIKARRPGVG